MSKITFTENILKKMEVYSPGEDNRCIKSVDVRIKHSLVLWKSGSHCLIGVGFCASRADVSAASVTAKSTSRPDYQVVKGLT